MGNDGHVTDVGRFVHQRANLVDREAVRNMSAKYSTTSSLSPERSSNRRLCGKTM